MFFFLFVVVEGGGGGGVQVTKHTFVMISVPQSGLTVYLLIGMTGRSGFLVARKRHSSFRVWGVRYRNYLQTLVPKVIVAIITVVMTTDMFIFLFLLVKYINFRTQVGWFL